MATLIRNGYVVTMNPQRELLPGGYVQTGADGTILAVGPAQECPADFAGRVFDAAGMLVLPGLVNAHQHTWQHLVMGQGAALAENGLQRCRAALNADDLRVASALAAAEMLSGGTTTVLHHMPPAADAASLAAGIEPLAAAGMRQVVALAHPWGAAGPADECLARWHGAAGGRVRLAVEVATDAQSVADGVATEAGMLAAYRFAQDHGLRLTTPTSSDAPQAMPWAQAIRHSGRSTVMHLMELGLLDGSWLLRQADHLADADLSLIRESGCHLVCTPLADAMRGVSSAAWTALARAGVNTALGSDGPARSATVDMVEQMKAMLLIQNTLRLDPTSMSAERVLEMATIAGARALGLAGETGSLEAGKRADIAVFDMNGPHFQISHKPISGFVSCARGADAALVLVDGRVVWQADALGDRVAGPDLTGLAGAGRAHARQLLARAGLPAAPTRRPALEP